MLIGRIVCTTCVVLCCATAAPAQTTRSGGTCEIEYGLEGIRCGTIERPTPGGGTLRVPYVRVTSRGPVAGPPLVYLAGGPGLTVLKDASAVRALSQFLAVDRDLILHDPRGIGLARPALDCPALRRSQTLIRAEDLSAEEVHRREAAAVSACGRELRARGVRLEDFTLDGNIDDLEALREALGIEQWDLMGHSAGALLAQGYLRRFPARVRAAVLDRPSVPGYPMYHSLRQWYEQSLNALGESCRGTSPCGEGILMMISEVHDALTRQPWTVLVDSTRLPTHRFVVNAVDFVGLLHGLLYDEASLPYVPRLIREFRDRNARTVARLIERTYGGPNLWSEGATYSAICTDAALARDPGLRSPATTALLKILKDVGDYGIAACREWFVTPPAPTALGEIPETVPVLVLSGQVDPVSPPENGAALAAQYRMGRHVVYTGSSHSVGRATGACAVAVLREFLASPGAIQAACAGQLEPVTFVDDLPAWAK